jgi:uncharacterized protein (TIGR02271 family)
MMKEQLREGMIVHSADGERLGKIVRCGPDGFVIEKGIFFKKEYIARYEDVASFDEDGVMLSRAKDELTLETEGVGLGREREPERVTVTVPVYEEEVEITKRPVVREEIVITKEAHQEQKTAEATVRKEKAEIEEEGEAESKRRAA